MEVDFQTFTSSTVKHYKKLLSWINLEILEIFTHTVKSQWKNPKRYWVQGSVNVGGL